MFNELEIVYWYLVNNETEIDLSKSEFFLDNLLSTAMYAKSLSSD